MPGLQGSIVNDLVGGARAGAFRLVGGLFAVYATLYLALAAVSVIYLPTRVAELAPDNRVGVLAIVSTTASLVVAFGQPAIGALSDRTPGRLGRRVPWMLVGALAAVVLIPALGVVSGIVALAVVWALCELALNTVLAPAAAVVVDRVPVRRRGLVSGVTGAGFLVGSAAGAALMGAVLFGSDAGVWLVCSVPLLGVLVFAALAPDRTRAPLADPPPPRRATWRARLARIAALPRQHPDFVWAFVSRALVLLAHAMLMTYVLYIAEDYLGLAPDRAAALAGLLVVVLLAASLPTLLLGGMLSDRTGRRKPVIVGAVAVMAGSLLIPLFAPTVPAMIVFATVFGLGYGAHTSVSKALNTLVVTDAERTAGRDLGILNIASSLPQIVAPSVAWFIVTVTGGFAGLFVASIVLALLGAGAILFVRSVR